MTSGAHKIGKSKGLVLNPLAEGAAPHGEYFGIREWRGQDLISLLFRTSIRMQTGFDRCFSQLGISAQEAAVLIHCVEAGTISAGKLAQAMGRDKGKITRFVDRLEAGSFVTRAGDPRDHRVLIIKATTRARRIAPRLKTIFEEVRERFLAGVMTDDIESLGSVLEKLHENAGQLYAAKGTGRTRKT